MCGMFCATHQKMGDKVTMAHDMMDSKQVRKFTDAPPRQAPEPEAEAEAEAQLEPEAPELPLPPPHHEQDPADVKLDIPEVELSPFTEVFIGDIAGATFMQDVLCHDFTGWNW